MAMLYWYGNGITRRWWMGLQINLEISVTAVFIFVVTPDFEYTDGF
jgi:hypothetical protein